MNRAGRRFPFFAGTWSGSAPLLLWALHFAFCYGAVAVGCTAILHGGAWLTAEQLRLLMGGATVLALALGALLLWRAFAAGRQVGGRLLPRVRLLGALMALVGMAWTGLPLALLPACGAG